MALIDFVFTRAGEATRIDKNGVIQTVPTNFPVVNFDDGDLLGYYSQRAATNLLLRSEEFENAYWLKLQAGTGLVPVVTPNTAIAPNGTMTADTVVFNRVGDLVTDISDLRGFATITIGETYNSSFYIKASAPSEVGKEIAFRSVGGTYAPIITLTSDWVRYDLTQVAIVGGSFRLETRGTITADASVSVHLWGAQLEVGTEATSYIRTEATAVTRPKDVATASALTLSPLSNVQFKANFPTGYELVLAGLQATVSGYATIRLELSPTAKTLFVNGVEQDSDTGSYDWSGVTSIELGHFDGDEQPNFEIADLRINE